MKKILYVHGLGGTKQGSTVNSLREIFENNNCKVISEDFPQEPYLYVNKIKELIDKENPDVLISSSLGAFMLMSVVYKYKINTKVIVINPALNPVEDIKENFGFGVKEFRKLREDGNQFYSLDNEFYKQLSELYDEFIDNHKGDFKANCFGVFSTNDEYFSHINDFKSLETDDYIIVDDTHHVSKDTLLKLKNIINNELKN